jgi:hypothetical protein
MLNFCGIVVAILKMAIGRNFSMPGIILSADHELVHGRSQELLDRIS